MKEILTPIVKRALRETVCNIGQLSHEEKLQLEYAVRKGVLSKGKGGSYPLLKTLYAVSGFNFEADRANRVAEMLRAHMIDMARGVAFPSVRFQ